MIQPLVLCCSPSVCFDKKVSEQISMNIHWEYMYLLVFLRKPLLFILTRVMIKVMIKVMIMIKVLIKVMIMLRGGSRAWDRDPAPLIMIMTLIMNLIMIMTLIMTLIIILISAAKKNRFSVE